MTRFYRLDGQDWVLIAGHFPVGDGIAPANWCELASEEEREAHGVFEGLAASDPEPGLKVLGLGVQDEGGRPREVWLTEAYEPEEINALRAATVVAVKVEASRRILSVYPLWRQSNMTKRACEIVDIRIDRALTEEEEAERQALKAAAAWVDTVRAASDDIEALIPNDAAGISAFDVAAHSAWPGNPA